ncbi:MAG TPA: hypothetical protein VFB19_18475 [Mycobacterium sp.]|nr:hypothetical protein [Mycobacterium sp.]
MTPTQCVELVAFIRARTPQTFLAEGTPDAWYPDLAPYDMAAAQEAVAALSRRPGLQPIGLGDLLVEIKRVRALRLERHGEPSVDHDPSDVEGWLAARREACRRIMDGETLPQPRAIESAPKPPGLVLDVGKPVPREDPRNGRPKRFSDAAKRAEAEAELERLREQGESA